MMEKSPSIKKRSWKLVLKILCRELGNIWAPARSSTAFLEIDPFNKKGKTNVR